MMTKRRYVEELLNTMGQLRKLIESQSQESHVERAATIMQFSALKFLKDSTHCTVGDLGDHMKLSKSSATQLIERLAKAGLVNRTHDRKDRRIVHVTITPAGEQKIIDLKTKFMDKIGKILSKIPDEDLKELARIHANLVETLQKDLPYDGKRSKK